MGRGRPLQCNRQQFILELVAKKKKKKITVFRGK